MQEETHARKKFMRMDVYLSEERTIDLIKKGAALVRDPVPMRCQKGAVSECGICVEKINHPINYQ
jgi:hypothetical protein